MKIAVADLRPNPFRDLERYPLDPQKVEALVQSIKETSFWDNVVARKDSDGGYELAYGTHRLAALKKTHTDEVDIPVRQLSNELMIKMMAHENQTEWAASAINDLETVRSIVKAFGEGKIELPKVTNSAKGPFRHAPHFVPDGGREIESRHQDSIYSTATLAKFLGGGKAWPESKVDNVLSTLAREEEGLIDSEDLKDLSLHQAAEVARQARRVEKETKDKTKAKAIGKALAEGMRSAGGKRGGRKPSERQAVTYHGARHAADKMMGKNIIKTKPKKPPHIDRFAEDADSDEGGQPFRLKAASDSDRLRTAFR